MSMKAWIDITRDHTVWDTSQGEYFIDMGVKIERLHSGAFRIYNANTTNFVEVTKDQYEIFNSDGFIKGAYNVYVGHLLDELKRSRYLPEKRKRIIAKYLQFKKKYTNFVQI